MIQNLNNRCEVCNTTVDNFENLVNHYFDSNHTQNDLIMKVKNPHIREILCLSKLPDSMNNNNTNLLEQNNSNRGFGAIPGQNSNINNSTGNLILNNINNNTNSNKPLSNNLNINNAHSSNAVKRICDICHVETEASYKGYALHVIQNHNPHVLHYIEDKFLIEFILKGGSTGIKKCDICNIIISLDVNDYIVHIQKNHSNLINKSLSKFIKDKYVVSVLLGKSIYKTTEYWSVCHICNEEIEGFEEFREHVIEHKKMQNAYKGFFGNLNASIVKKEVLGNLKKDQEEEQMYNSKNNNCSQWGVFDFKNQIKEKPGAQMKEEALEEFTNLLKNVNEKLLLNNVNSACKQDAKDEEIKMLREKLSSLESKINGMEDQYKKDIEERDNVTAEIQNLMDSKNFKVNDIQNELAKLKILEDRINENSKKIEDEKHIRKNEIEKIHEQNTLKIKENELKLELLETNFSKSNSDKDKNFMEKFHEQEKLIANIEKETLGLKENFYNKKPAEWEEQDSNLKLVELPTNSPEFVSISKMFNVTYSQGKISKITRIQNLELWKNFCYGKLQLKKKGNDTGRLLFHGTRGTDPAIVYSGIEEGFDMRYASPTGFFGVAIYFHERAAYSHDYRFSQNGLNYMLVANVIIGDSFNMPQIDKSLRLPPFKDKNNSVRYDSVNSEGKYMVYNNFRAYPAYLVQYTS